MQGSSFRFVSVAALSATAIFTASGCSSGQNGVQDSDDQVVTEGAALGSTYCSSTFAPVAASATISTAGELVIPRRTGFDMRVAAETDETVSSSTKTTVHAIRVGTAGSEAFLKAARGVVHICAYAESAGKLVLNSAASRDLTMNGQNQNAAYANPGINWIVVAAERPADLAISLTPIFVTCDAIKASVVKAVTANRVDVPIADQPTNVKTGWVGTTMVSGRFLYNAGDPHQDDTLFFANHPAGGPNARFTICDFSLRAGVDWANVSAANLIQADRIVKQTNGVGENGNADDVATWLSNATPAGGSPNRVIGLFVHKAALPTPWGPQTTNVDVALSR